MYLCTCYLLVYLEYRIQQIPFPQHAPLPVVDERNDKGQQAQAVIGREDRHAKQVPEADQHEEMLQGAAMFCQGADLVVDRHAVKNFTGSTGKLSKDAFHSVK